MARARAKAKPAEDADAVNAMREEWSCPLCTLLNKWDTTVCGACAQERPEDVAPVPREWTCGACTLVNEWTDERCAACFQERPPASDASGASANQTSADASAVGRSHGFTALEDGVGLKRETDAVETDATMRSSRRTSRKRPLSPAQPKQEVESPPRPASRYADPPAVDAKEEETEPKGLPEAPTFNLLGFMNPPEDPASPDNRRMSTNKPEPFEHAERPSFSLLGESAAIDLTSVPDADPVRLNETEAKLAQAGLDLSESDSGDDRRQRHKLRRKSLTKAVATQDTKVAVKSSSSHYKNGGDGDVGWDCEVCTERNAAHLDRCELCNSKRNQLSSVFAASRKPKASPPPPVTSSDKVECAVCTHWNPRNVDNCELCDVAFEKVQCHVCAHMNPHTFECCELCESTRASATRLNSNPSSSNVTTKPETKIACPVCTNLNDPHLENCEMCETNLAVASRPRRQTARYDLIDLASSQPDAKGHSGSDSDGEAEYDPHAASDSDDDFEHIYPTRARSPEYPPLPPYAPPRSPPRRRQRDRTNYDRIEEISDNEMQGGVRSAFQPPPVRSKRPELTEFQHFLSVEDSRLDYACQIDYRSMFAESSASRTYADRLQKRRRDSQKRKRTHAKNDLLSQDEAPARRGRAGGKKGGKKGGGKKAKAKAAPRRASTGPPAAKKARAPKRAAAAKPRRTSASAFSSGISHYDTTGGDFGDDVTTMAWEGLGSAGYC